MNQNLLFKAKLLLIGLALLCSKSIYAQSTTQPEGEGTVENPYQISSLENLLWLSVNEYEWNKHYIQTTDIDASETWDWEGGEGFPPIATYENGFSGSYNGKGHVIDSLYINNTSKDHIGLFANLTETAVIDSLGVTNATVSGSYKVGVLSSRNLGIIRDCFTTGSIDATSYVGGFVGFNIQGGKIMRSYSAVNVNGESHYSGGFCAKNYGYIQECYAAGIVYGQLATGGFAGVNEDTLVNSYSLGKVIASGEAGTIVGRQNGGLLQTCYSNGSIFNGDAVYGVKNGGIVSLCYYNTDSVSTKSPKLSTFGLTTDEMKDTANYDLDFTLVSADGEDDSWAQNDSINNGFPFLTWQWEGFEMLTGELTDLEGVCSVMVDSYPEALGIYGDTITATTNDPMEYTEQGEFTHEWLFTEGSNQMSQYQNILVEDLEQPELTAIEDQAVEIEADETVYVVSGNEFDVTEYSDNCEVLSIVNDFNDSETLAGAELPEGITTITWTVSDAAGNTNDCSYDVTVTIAETTSDEEIELANEVTVYPNPVKNTVNVAIEGQVIDRIEVLDMAGKVILEKKVKQYQTELDMSVATPGVYFVHIYTSQKIITRKLLKN